MNLNAVVGDLVRDFRGKSLAHRSQHCGDLRIEFRFLGTLVKRDVRIPQIDHLRGLVKQRAGGGDFDLHLCKHVVNRGELVNALLELHTLGSIFLCFAVSGFGNTESLSADRHAGAVHQTHDVLRQTTAFLSAEFRRNVVVLKFGGRHAVNTELVLNTANLEFRTGFADEHGKSASVNRSLFGTGKYEMDLRAAIGNEALHTVEIPLAIGSLRRFETDGLEVGTGIRLGEVHGTVRFAGSETRKIFLTLFFGTELADRFRNILKTDQVLQRSIGAGDHFRHHRIDGSREIESAVLTRKHDAHDSGILEILEILVGQRMILDNAVFEIRPLFVHLPGTGSDAFAGDLADHFHHAFVVIHRIFVVLRCEIELFRLLVIVFTKRDDLFHFQIPEREHQVRIVGKKVGHSLFSSRFGFVRFDHHRNDLIEVSDNTVVRNRENRRGGIGVDRDDLFTFAHSGAVLDRAADAAGDVQLRTDRHTGLADLMIMVNPAGINRRTGCSDFAAESLCQFVNQLEVFLGTDSVAARYNDLGAFQIHGFILTNTLNHFDDRLFRRQSHIDFDDLAGRIRLGFRHLHDALADGHHLRIVPGVDNGRNDVSAECRTDLHQFVFIEFLVDFVIKIVDPQIGTVGGESGELLGSDARSEFASFHGRAEQQDVRFMFTDQVHDDFGERQNRKRLQTRIIGEIDFFAAVLEQRAAAAFHIGAEQNGFNIDAERGRKFHALADEFQTDVRDLAAFLLNKNPDISNLFRHDNHPNVWSSMSS